MSQAALENPMSPPRSDLANAVRALSMDAVQKANSGHPGAPMGMADIAEVLWNDYLSHNPANPAWPNRDRFVLSNGHGSMLLYSLLHLSGYDLPIGEIRGFRQLHSKTPGHPEYGYTPGVETTTGPLGQGLALLQGASETWTEEKDDAPGQSRGYRGSEPERAVPGRAQIPGSQAARRPWQRDGWLPCGRGCRGCRRG